MTTGVYPRMSALKGNPEIGDNLFMAETLAHLLWKRILPKRADSRESAPKPVFCHSPLTDLENDLLPALIRVGPHINTSDKEGSQEKPRNQKTWES
jgi:hypothetical protein